MKIYLSDIMGLCCPEGVELSVCDSELTGRIKAQVMDKIGFTHTRRRRRVLRTAVLIAAAVALFTTAAYAVSGFIMNRASVSDTQTGRWRIVDDRGELISEQLMTFPDAGMVLSFSGPEEQFPSPELRAFWLPSEPVVGYTDEEGWTSYLSDDGEGDRLPYQIAAANVNTDDFRYVLSGEASVVKEERWGDWLFLAISSDYSECTLPWSYENDRANYILLFDETRGYLISIKGTSDMETLEHIARELEIREGGEPAPAPSFTAEIGMLDVGRG